jgi:hypothetical protein
VVEPNVPLRLSLLDALQVAARNSPDYQTRKENVFRAALDLDLQRNNFRNIFFANARGDLAVDTTGPETVSVVTARGAAGVDRRLINGMTLGAAMAIDLTRLLTQGGARTLGLATDASVSMPLLRGAGRHIVAEPLTQAERNVIYELWNFERFKHTFAVSITREYFNVLRQMDVVRNAEENYRSAITSARWSRRRAEAGRIREIEVDQAFQRELSARNGWISAQERLRTQLDSFKSTLGLPPDAHIELDRADLEQLQVRATQLVEQMRARRTITAVAVTPVPNGEVEPIERRNPGPGPCRRCAGRAGAAQRGGRRTVRNRGRGGDPDRP